MVSKNVLALTYEEDPHADSVGNYLNEKGMEFFRVNTDKLIGNYSVSFDSRKGFTVSNGYDEIVVDDKWNIWNRRIIDPEVPGEIHDDLEKIIFTETKKTWESLLFSAKGKVVNRPQAQNAANNKIDQILFARDFGGGIKIPKTLLTNNPRDFVNFYEENVSLCHKLQRQSMVEKEGEFFTIYTGLVNEQHLENSGLVKMNPCLFQEYIEKEYELRITALEDEVIGIAIYSQDSDVSRIDWRRYDFENVEYEKVDLPEHVEGFCKKMMKHYGLRFGQIDMILNPDGDYVFLELNPNGQWLWLEEQSGYDLTRKVSENLIK